MDVKQFDVVLVRLDPVLGSEQRGTRPCVILQTNALADAGRTIIIAPCTSQKLNRIYPQEILMNPSKQNGLTQPSKIKIDQVRVIDTQRIAKKIGTLEKEYHVPILRAIDIIFDREQLFQET
ncbi:MAG TPA: type II toxin-antitoxin system PemK/MazF family toxin [Candidatus Peribacterales bacterium]|nr:type II toxin-antitoxin system PemK/MazF family toxin [Candidatus Peribacterales bacterium]